MTALRHAVAPSAAWLLPRSYVPLRLLTRNLGTAAAAPVTPTVLPAANQANTTTEQNDELGSPRGIPGCAMHELTVNHIRAAHSRIKQYIPRSPLDYSHKLSQQHDCSLFLKKEHLSMTGSYKERGALNKLMLLSEEEKRRGVICASAGNHAQAVSHHSTRMGISGLIVMPQNTPHVKVRATRGYGGQVVLHGESFGEAFAHSMEIAKKEGRTFVHAFNDSDIVAGQGTVAIDVLEQNPFVEAVLVPTGGGGLIAGMAKFLKEINPRIKVYGVEAENSPGMKQSLEAGHVVSVPRKATMADGISIETVGLVPFKIIQQYVDKIVTVDENEIAAAVLTLMEVEKTITEGSGATAVAAVMFGKLKEELRGKNVVAVCTGGNIDATLLGRIIDKGLFKSGRLCRIHLTCMDAPGQLALALQIISACRANVRDVIHERAFLLNSVGITQPIITLETRDFDHVDEVVNALQAANFENVFVDSPDSAPVRAWNLTHQQSARPRT